MSSFTKLGATYQSTGDGGAIALTHSGSGATSGDGPDGIVLQSTIGGGDYVKTSMPAAQVTVTERSANSGDGGDIAFDLSRDVTVSGGESVGILAQSLAGDGEVDDLLRDASGSKGADGTIDLAGTGNVLASGESGIGGLAQSLCRSDAGSIRGDLDDVVMGGSGKFRDESLNLHCFRSLRHVREEIGRWRNHHNTMRPLSALGYLSQRSFRRKPTFQRVRRRQSQRRRTKLKPNRRIPVQSDLNIAGRSLGLYKTVSK